MECEGENGEVGVCVCVGEEECLCEMGNGGYSVCVREREEGEYWE